MHSPLVKVTSAGSTPYLAAALCRASSSLRPQTHRSWQQPRHTTNQSPSQTPTTLHMSTRPNTGSDLETDVLGTFFQCELRHEPNINMKAYSQMQRPAGGWKKEVPLGKQGPGDPTTAVWKCTNHCSATKDTSSRAKNIQP